MYLNRIVWYALETQIINIIQNFKSNTADTIQFVYVSRGI